MRPLTFLLQTDHVTTSDSAMMAVSLDADQSLQAELKCTSDDIAS